MEEEKILKQKPHTSFNRRLSFAKNPKENMTTANKNVKIFYLQGEHDKGGIWQRIWRYIKQRKSPTEFNKSSLVNLSRSIVFERCKRYKENISIERKSGSGRKTKYIDEHIQYLLNLINTDLNITSAQIR